MRTTILLVSFVAFLAIISGGPSPYSRGSHIWGAEPDPIEIAPLKGDCTYYKQTQSKNCLDKDGAYCGVKWQACRTAGIGEKNDATCVIGGSADSACDNKACNNLANPANGDKLKWDGKHCNPTDGQ